LQGWILKVRPSNPVHAQVIRRLTRLLHEVLDHRIDVSVQLPFAASDDSQPEPDIAVIPIGDYLDDHPSRAHLIVEVADSSLRAGCQSKAQIYAEAGVGDYWIVNRVDDLIEVYREPTAEGYGSVTSFRRGQRIALLDFPDTIIAVDDILPPG